MVYFRHKEGSSMVQRFTAIVFGISLVYNIHVHSIHYVHTYSTVTH